MMTLKLSWCLLLIFAQMFLVTSWKLPRGLMRASEVYFLPWTEGPPKPTRPPTDLCSMDLTCRDKDGVRNATMRDITGPKGFMGAIGQPGFPGMQGYPGPPGNSGSPKCKVAFSVALKSLVYASAVKGEPVMFDSVKSNFGGAYRKDKGQFVTPHNGTYIFHVKVAARQEGTTAALHIHHNDNWNGTVWVHYLKNSWSSSSNQFVFDLKAGDLIYLSIRPDVPKLSIGETTTFSGRCLWKEIE